MRIDYRVLFILLLGLILSSGCSSSATQEIEEPMAATPTVNENLPQITSVHWTTLKCLSMSPLRSLWR